MNCYLCGKPANSKMQAISKEIPYCGKHYVEIMVAVDTLEEDPKALEKLQKKYKSKKK